MCRDCFLKYFHTKVVKRMEQFRVRHSTPGKQRLLLLPVSFGPSSLSLLHVINEHLESQKRHTGRTGYSIHVVFVDMSTIEGSSRDPRERLEQLKTRYPSWEYSVIDISEVGSLPDFHNLCQEALQEIPHDSRNLDQLLASLPSTSSRSDVISILRSHLLIHFAKQSGCECIMWGDSTTRLAERTLSETAKGRGFSLPWAISDGPTPHGINYHFPMRDLLRKEISVFAELVQPSLQPLLDQNKAEVIATAKTTSIDALMTQYFESVEENYPSIVANVVRTTSRLSAPVTQAGQKCTLCQMPMDAEVTGNGAWGGYQETEAEDRLGGVESPDSFCYGCMRTMPVPNTQNMRNNGITR
ncbi:MAG: cytoplasmic tRNA 2-thiolation protein 2 [Bathelium mastoideum]|nr:MAG: cytoplasmic tRNA 2-thiolation protein 2 [Bathelium mastoideum]